LVAVEGDLMDVGGESVGVVAECVLDRAEDLFGWRVGERFGHLACALLEERLEACHEFADAGFAGAGFADDAVGDEGLPAGLVAG